MTKFKKVKMDVTDPDTGESSEIDGELTEDQIFSMLDLSTRPLHIVARGKDEEMIIQIIDISTIWMDTEPDQVKMPKTMAFFF